jgi:hypothetical protein
LSRGQPLGFRRRPRLIAVGKDQRFFAITWVIRGWHGMGLNSSENKK